MATAAERLEEARSALHLLLIGQQMVTVRDASGDMVTYSRANESRLREYIKELEAEVIGNTSRLIYRPMRPVFG